MKNKFLYYCIALISTLSLQSCVTNYVVSNPAANTYKDQYKSNAKLASLDQQKLEKAKTQLLSSFDNDENIAKLTQFENNLKNIEIKKALSHAKTIDQILAEAETYIGTPYRYGGTTRNGIDCSAFVLSVFDSSVGLQLPRVAAAQSKEGLSIEKAQLEKGDLVFFSHGRGIAHVGIVYNVDENGEVKFIHASTSRGVMISSLNDSYWGPRYRFAKRILNEDNQPVL